MVDQVQSAGPEFGPEDLPPATPTRPNLSGGIPEEPLVIPEWPAVPPSTTVPSSSGRALRKPQVQKPHAQLTWQQRLLLMDTWRRSGLPATDFAELVGVSKHTLYTWKRRFDAGGPEALMDRPRPQRGDLKLPEVIRRTILMLKEDNPDWGGQRISDVLARHPGLAASPSTVLKVLHEAGYESTEQPTEAHPDRVRSFERARPNQLWQTDLFTFILRRQNRRVYLVVFMDDHSRFITGYGLHATASALLVIEVFRAAITSHHAPEEVLTDNGTQYVTWRGRSSFVKECQARGIKHIVSSPRHPQTLGKCERFWGTLWQECLKTAVFIDLEDARRRIGLFIDHYNFQRPHQGIDGAVPADRFFGAASEVRDTLKARVAANALTLARQGVPRPPFYLTGNVGDQPVSVHQEGDRLILNREGERIELAGPPPTQPAKLPDVVCPQAAPAGDEGSEPPAAPGESALDDLTGGAR